MSQHKTKDTYAQSAFYISPALLTDRDVLGELLFLCINNQGEFIVLSFDARRISVVILCCIDDGLLIEGLREDALGRGVAKQGVVSGDGGDGEKCEEDLHVWISVL